MYYCRSCHVRTVAQEGGICPQCQQFEQNQIPVRPRPVRSVPFDTPANPSAPIRRTTRPLLQTNPAPAPIERPAPAPVERQPVSKPAAAEPVKPKAAPRLPEAQGMVKSVREYKNTSSNMMRWLEAAFRGTQFALSDDVTVLKIADDTGSETEVVAFGRVGHNTMLEGRAVRVNGKRTKDGKLIAKAIQNAADGSQVTINAICIPALAVRLVSLVLLCPLVFCALLMLSYSSGLSLVNVFGFNTEALITALASVSMLVVSVGLVGFFAAKLMAVLKGSKHGFISTLSYLAISGGFLLFILKCIF